MKPLELGERKRRMRIGLADWLLIASMASCDADSSVRNLGEEAKTTATNDSNDSNSHFTSHSTHGASTSSDPISTTHPTSTTSIQSSGTSIESTDPIDDGSTTASTTTNSQTSQSDSTTASTSSHTDLSDSITTTSSDTSSTTTDTSTSGEIGGLARGINLSDIDFNQGVAVPLARSGTLLAPADRSIRIVSGRGALVRAFWQLEPTWTSRAIAGRLQLSYPGGSTRVLEDRKVISGPSNRATMAGGFNWELSAAHVVPGMRFSVELREIDAIGGHLPGQTPRLPTSGEADLAVPANPMVIDLMLVPVRVAGVSPNLSPANVEQLVQGFYNMNPVQEIRATVHAEINASGSGIESVLAATSSLRAAESPPPNRYYLGLAAQSVVGWSGLSQLGSEDMAGERSSASPISDTPGNYPLDNSWGFTVHELGHAQGRMHTPGCGAAQPDPNWPYGSDNTTINTQGYDLSRHVLRSEESEDYMNFCTPDWPSPYIWEHTYSRIATLSSWTSPRLATPTTFVLHGVVRSDGTGSPIWWVTPGHASTRPLHAQNVQVVGTHKNGTTSKSSGFIAYSCADFSIIEAELASSPSAWTTLEVRSDNQSYRLVPATLLSQYEELRSKFGDGAREAASDNR